MNAPDVGLGYFESRMLRCNNESVRPNSTTLYVMGVKTADLINNLEEKEVVLDLSRNKAINFEPFLSGLIPNLKTAKMPSGVELKSYSVNPEKYTFKS